MAQNQRLNSSKADLQPLPSTFHEKKKEKKKKVETEYSIMQMMLELDSDVILTSQIIRQNFDQDLI